MAGTENDNITPSGGKRNFSSLKLPADFAERLKLPAEFRRLKSLLSALHLPEVREIIAAVQALERKKTAIEETLRTYKEWLVGRGVDRRFWDPTAKAPVKKAPVEKIPVEEIPTEKTTAELVPESGEPSAQQEPTVTEETQKERPQSEWDPQSEWCVERVMQELGIKGKEIIEAVAELPKRLKRYRAKSIPKMLDDIRAADLHRAIEEVGKLSSPDSCENFMNAWKAWRGSAS